jgi:hypothetical protein
MTSMVNTASMGYQNSSIPSGVGSFDTQSTREIQGGTNARAAQSVHQRCARSVATTTPADSNGNPMVHPLPYMPSSSVHWISAATTPAPTVATTATTALGTAVWITAASSTS